jgi:hypothetical protein
MTFCGLGGVFSFAAMAGRLIKPAASADAAASCQTVTIGLLANFAHAFPHAVAGRDDIS